MPLSALTPAPARMKTRSVEETASINGKCTEVLVPEMSYHRMAVANGQDAGLAWELLVRGNLVGGERDRVEKALLEYCGQDTLALIKLVERLQVAST